MPRPIARTNEQLSLRFKNGKHTLYLLVSPLTPFSQITIELLEALRERYPAGLPSSTSTEPTPIPDSDDATVLYGVLKAPTDPSQGWKLLDISDDENPTQKGLKNNAVVGFKFTSADDDAEQADFEVEFPVPEDEE